VFFCVPWSRGLLEERLSQLEAILAKSGGGADTFSFRTLKPMDFVRSGGFTMSGLPLSSYQPRLAAALKNQQVRLR